MAAKNSELYEKALSGKNGPGEAAKGRKVDLDEVGMAIYLSPSPN